MDLVVSRCFGVQRNTSRGYSAALRPTTFQSNVRLRSSWSIICAPLERSGCNFRRLSSRAPTRSSNEAAADLGATIAEARDAGAQALVFLSSPRISRQLSPWAGLALKEGCRQSRLFPEFAPAGALLSY